MAVKNVVVAGDYKGYIDFKSKKKGLYIYGAFGLGKKTFINKDTVQSYEVIGEEGQKSMSSGIIKGAVGGALFGGIGAIAGASSGKNKGVYTVSIIFKDGTKCLCELDNEMYKNLVAALY